MSQLHRQNKNLTIFEGFMPLKPYWNKLVTSGENAKTCPTLISDSNMAKWLRQKCQDKFQEEAR